jgi:hypothetical protein
MSVVDIGRQVFQYDPVARREAVGEIVGERWAYVASFDGERLLVDVKWSDADGGVTTSHLLTKFSAVAGRSDLLLAD